MDGYKKKKNATDGVAIIVDRGSRIAETMPPAEKRTRGGVGNLRLK